MGHLPKTQTQLYSDLDTTNNNLSNSRKIVQVSTDDHGFSLGYDASGLYTLVDLTRFYLASKSDLINIKYLANEFNPYNDTIALTSTAADGSQIQLSTDGTNLYLNKKLKGATDWTTVWKK